MSAPSVEQEALKKAAVALRAMRGRLADLEAERREPIAIVGMGCRFPGDVDSPAAFWRLLDAGKDAVTEVPPERWPVDDFFSADPEEPFKSYSRHMGYVANVDQFDPRLFRISPREAEGMDPQQRLLLEVTWEALEDARILPKDLVGSRTGVFVGITAGDYGQLAGTINAHSLTGNVTSIAVGRISYTFGLKGPCYPIDTACSSSLVALHAGCQSLRARECNAALVGGVHLILSPLATIGFSKLRALSHDGRCKAFDRSADGYVRGEGCGIVVLKRLSDALAAGDRILALVRGSSVNQDGRSSGLTAPNGPSQQDVIRVALRQGDVLPNDVQYVEAHGTGTALGDPIEIQAIDAVYRQGRSSDDPVLVGSVKTNIGHLELAAGMASLMKVVLALGHERIPRQLHFREPNPNVAWSDLLVSIADKSRAWPRGQKPRRAGVSGFGFSGTNAHAVIEEASPLARRSPQPRSHHLLVLSGTSPEVLRRQAQRYALHLRACPDQAIGDVCLSAATTRTQFDHRLAIVTPDAGEMARVLREFALTGESGDAVVGARTAGADKLAFVCGNRPIPAEVYGYELYEGSEVVRTAWDACDRALIALGEAPVLEALRRGPSESLSLEVRHIAAFCMQYASAELWRSWGVQPDVVIGYGMGEYAAACIAGAMPVESALRLVVSRARSTLRAPGAEKCLAVRANATEVEFALRDHGARIVAIDGSGHIVVVVPSARFEGVVAALEQHRIDSVCLTDDVIPGMPLDPASDDDGPAERGVRFERLRYALVQSDGSLTEAQASPGDWAGRRRARANFEACVATALGRGVRTFLELSPDPTLLPLIRLRQEDLTLVASARRGESGWFTSLRAAAVLHVGGVALDWAAVMEPYASGHVDLPTYAFDRQRYWLGDSTPTRRPDAVVPATSMLGEPVGLSDGRIHLLGVLAVDRQPYLKDHLIYGEVVVPGAFYVAGMLAAASKLWSGPIEMADILFREMFQLDGELALDTVLTKEKGGGFSFEVMSAAPAGGADTEVSWRQHSAGRIAPAGDGPNVAFEDIPAIQARCPVREVCAQAMVSAQVDAVWRGPSFEWTRDLWRGDGEALFRFEMPEVPHADVGVCSPGLLDSLWNCIFGALPDEFVQAAQAPFLPFHIGRIRFHRPPPKRVWGYGRVRELRPDQVGGDIVVMDERGERVIELERVVLRCAPRDRIAKAGQPGAPLTYSVQWRRAEPLARSDGASRGGRGAWLLVGVRDELTAQIASRLAERGERCVWAPPDGDLVRTLGELEKEGAALRAAIDVRPLAATGSNGAGHTDPLEVQRRVCGASLSLLQALLGTRGSPRLVVVTRGACPADPHTEVALEQSTLSGFCRAVAAEHPEYGVLHLDLDPASRDSDASRIVDEATNLADIAEVQVAYRSSTRLVPRLTLAAPRANIADDRPIVPDATYLVTGGTGGLGLLVARWLVDRGARCLVLLSRGSRAESLEGVETLRGLGARVVVAVADVARRDDLTRVLAEIGRDLPALRGVVHAAGILDDGGLAHQTWERFERVLASKVAGSVHLHDLTRNMPLDFFVLFSSVSAVFGAAGQSNYAAANAFLDGLAHERRRVGLPAVSIAWGPWATAGMAAARGPEFARRLSDQGIGLIGEEAGLAALGETLHHEQAHVAVVTIDWRKVLSGVDREAVPGLFEDWRHLARTKKIRPDAELDRRLRAAEEHERLEHCLEYVRAQVRATLGLHGQDDLADHRPFAELGMDSLLAVDLRNVLSAAAAVSLEPTVAFTHPNCADLASELHARWTEQSGASLPPAPHHNGNGTHAAPPVLTPAPARSASNPWFPYRVRRSAPRLRLLCLPYILGSASVYSSWPKKLPHDIEVCALELPGRWTRSHEKPIGSLPALLPDLFAATQDLLDAPLAIFGYSFGALLGFELARRLRAEDGTAPVHLFVASLHAPQVRVARNDLFLLPDEDLLLHFEQAYGAVPGSLVTDEASRRHLVRNARADLSCLDNYAYRAEPPLSCPITAIGAEDDPLESISDMRAWKAQTTEQFQFRSFSGGHLFVHSHGDEVTKLVTSTLDVRNTLEEKFQ